MNTEIINLFYPITLSIITIFCSIFIIYFNRHTGNKYIDNFDGVQKFHISPTPRLGGTAIFIAFLISIFFINESRGVLLLIILSSFPIFLSGLLEDLFEI